MNPAELRWRNIRQLLDEFDFGARILQFVTEFYGSGAILSAWQEFRGRDLRSDEGTLFEFGSDSPFAKLFISWCAHSWIQQDPDESADPDLLQLVPTWAFLERNPGLDPLLYRYLESCTYAPFSFYEVMRCEVDRPLKCRDIVVGRDYETLAESFVESPKAGDIVYARLVEIDGIALIEARSPVVFPAGMKQMMVGLIDLLLEGTSLPLEIGRARQFLEDREVQIRKIFWDLTYLLVPPRPLDERPGSGVKPRLH